MATLNYCLCDCLPGGPALCLAQFCVLWCLLLEFPRCPWIFVKVNQQLFLFFCVFLGQALFAKLFTSHFVLCAWVFCRSVLCLCTTFLCGVHRGQIRVSAPLELQLQISVSCLVGAGNLPPPPSPAGPTNASNPEPSLLSQTSQLLMLTWLLDQSILFPMVMILMQSLPQFERDPLILSVIS